MMQGNISFGGFDLQRPLRVNHHHQPLGTSHQHRRQGSSMVNVDLIRENLPLMIGNNQDCDQTVSVVDFDKLDRGKAASDEDEPSFTEDAGDGHNDMGKAKMASSPWHRVKWTDNMVRLLITSVLYISEEAAAEHGSGIRRKCANLQKKGKWKSVSKVMAERGHFVSPQQCEDKFNDLNKRYKRLNEILGRGTSCDVVENQALLDAMDHISEKAKEEVRKILSSKHLHYEEMCSYHNGNHLHLPHDPDLQRSLHLALRIRDDHEDNDPKRHSHAEYDQEGDGESEDNQSMLGDHHIHRAYKLPSNSAKKAKQCQNNNVDCNKTINLLAENDDPAMQKHWLNHRNRQIEEKRLYIEAEMLELEKERLKWQRLSREKDRELEMMRMENERMKMENDQIALEIRQKEIEMGIHHNN